MYDQKTILTPSLKNTPVHRMDPRTKIITLAAVSVAAISIDKPGALLLLLALSLIGYPMAGISLKKVKVLGLLLFLLIWGTIYSQALFYQQYPRTILFTILGENSFGREWDGLHVFQEGIEYGAIQSIRFAATTSLALLIYWTTQPNAMLFGLIRLRVPYGLAFMVITSLRFVPLIISESITVIRAQRLKGYRPFKPGNWIKTIFGVLLPVLSNCMRRSVKLAISVGGRSFKPDAPRTYLKADILKFGVIDKALIALCFLVVPVVIFKLLLWLYGNNIFYLSELRWTYEIAGNYLFNE